MLDVTCIRAPCQQRCLSFEPSKLPLSFLSVSLSLYVCEAVSVCLSVSGLSLARSHAASQRRSLSSLVKTSTMVMSASTPATAHMAAHTQPGSQAAHTQPGSQAAKQHTHTHPRRRVTRQQPADARMSNSISCVHMMLASAASFNVRCPGTLDVRASLYARLVKSARASMVCTHTLTESIRSALHLRPDTPHAVQRA